MERSMYQPILQHILPLHLLIHNGVELSANHWSIRLRSTSVAWSIKDRFPKSLRKEVEILLQWLPLLFKRIFLLYRVISSPINSQFRIPARIESMSCGEAKTLSMVESLSRAKCTHQRWWSQWTMLVRPTFNSQQHSRGDGRISMPNLLRWKFSDQCQGMRNAHGMKI